jgi:hypothetical protein
MRIDLLFITQPWGSSLQQRQGFQSTSNTQTHIVNIKMQVPNGDRTRHEQQASPMRNTICGLRTRLAGSRMRNDDNSLVLPFRRTPRARRMGWTTSLPGLRRHVVLHDGHQGVTEGGNTTSACVLDGIHGKDKAGTRHRASSEHN